MAAVAVLAPSEPAVEFAPGGPEAGLHLVWAKTQTVTGKDFGVDLTAARADEERARRVEGDAPKQRGGAARGGPDGPLPTFAQEKP